MLKVVAVTDKYNSAIDRIARGMADYHDNIEYHVLDIHPKRPDERQIREWEKHYPDADILDFGYFRTAEMLKERYDLDDKPQILQHHNPYSITESDWNDYDIVCCNNESIYKDLQKITMSRLEMISNSIDTNFWTFNTDWKPNKRVLMVAARIEGKKGILEAAQATEKAGGQFVLVGSISDTNYFHEVLQSTNVEYHENISDEALRDLYWNSGLHICNSRDNFESGTQPVVESMMTGLPVISRNVGHVPELEGYIENTHKETDVEHLAELIKDAFDNPDKLKELRSKAWNSVKNRSNERRAYSYQKLYRSLQSPDEPVTIVTPVYKRPEITQECLEAIGKQDYPNLEVIVVEDDTESPNKQVVDKWKTTVNFPVRYMKTDYEGYGLAKARNMAIIEATGDTIVFCDQRIKMEPKAVTELINRLKPKVWAYGTKGTKKGFVENFSAVRREDVVNFGMFNERATEYGALSQETRERFRRQGGRTEFVEEAKASQIGKSGSRYNKHQQIINSKNWLWKVGL